TGQRLILTVRAPAPQQVAGSKLQLEAELHFPRAARRSNDAEPRRSHVHGSTRLVEVGPVEEVEYLPAELDVETIVAAEAGVFRNTQIPIDQTGSDDDVAPAGTESQRTRGKIQKRYVARTAGRVPRFHDVTIRITRVVHQRSDE